ncbi:hypothetical protein GUJ93_ZPchr0009g864 [Zizania palustris]|uniref:Uncharacterized protein n=1 Tax=Zizania palustris TaxID=103762 RepID=A0A8J5S429_ZIZPA|nr:hypothetical protein GUJ93_ZPchr0009g864 [Zizania palustris]
MHMNRLGETKQRRERTYVTADREALDQSNVAPSGIHTLSHAIGRQSPVASLSLSFPLSHSDFLKYTRIALSFTLSFPCGTQLPLLPRVECTQLAFLPRGERAQLLFFPLDEHAQQQCRLLFPMHVAASCFSHVVRTQLWFFSRAAHMQGSFFPRGAHAGKLFPTRRTCREAFSLFPARRACSADFSS